MDRFDEKRDRHDVSDRIEGDERIERDERGDRDEADRAPGDVLGLGGSPVPKEPGDPSTDFDPDSVARRRERMREGDTTGVSGEDPDRQRSGGTGIDMGAGGQGTHVSGK